jgi:ankyrin repeat protein
MVFALIQKHDVTGLSHYLERLPEMEGQLSILDRTDQQGQTPLHSVLCQKAFQAQCQLALLLMAHGADPYLRNGKGETACLLIEQLKDTKMKQKLKAACLTQQDMRLQEGGFEDEGGSAAA